LILHQVSHLCSLVAFHFSFLSNLQFLLIFLSAFCSFSIPYSSNHRPSPALSSPNCHTFPALPPPQSYFSDFLTPRLPPSFYLFGLFTLLPSSIVVRSPPHPPPQTNLSHNEVFYTKKEKNWNGRGQA
jgi:hypothetical protein